MKETPLEVIARECAGDLQAQVRRVAELVAYHETEILILRGALAMLQAQARQLSAASEAVVP